MIESTLPRLSRHSRRSGANLAFTFASQASLDDALVALNGRFQISSAPGPSELVTLLDTFDWRLWRRGDVLRHVRPAAKAAAGRLDWRISRLDLLPTPVDRIPEFAADLPAGRLGAAVAKAMSIRRLLPIAEVNQTVDTVCVLDERRKTVVRLRIARGTIRGLRARRPIPRPLTLTVERLRGFDRPFEAVVGILRAVPDIEEISGPTHGHLLLAAGLKPGGYSGKFDLELERTMRADEAAKAIHRSLLEVIEANEDGVRKDLDSEFLHDFRVSVRRTRSALTQIKGVFPDRDLDRFRREFAWLGKVTGPTRDLDVWLLEVDSYGRALAQSNQQDEQATADDGETRDQAADEDHPLIPLKEHLKTRQAQEHRRLVRALDSARYRRLLKDWHAFLDRPCPSPSPSRSKSMPKNAVRPIGKVLGRRLTKVFNRVVEVGRRIDRESPAESLHDLRIACKKLRYLLEFGRSLPSRDSIEPVIKSLKRLQDVLGRFNDFEVQQSSLVSFAHEMLATAKAAEAAAASTLVALGRLVERLAEAQEAERQAFFAAFERFDRTGTHKTFRRLTKEMAR